MTASHTINLPALAGILPVKYWKLYTKKFKYDPNSFTNNDHIVCINVEGRPGLAASCQLTRAPYFLHLGVVFVPNSSISYIPKLYLSNFKILFSIYKLGIFDRTWSFVFIKNTWHTLTQWVLNSTSHCIVVFGQND